MGLLSHLLVWHLAFFGFNNLQMVFGSDPQYAQRHSCMRELQSLDTVKIRIFEVSGTTPKDLLESIIKNGPKGETGRAYDAYTEWQISWKWPLNDHTPLLSKSEVDSKIIVNLPSLREAPENPKLQGAWIEYQNKLIGHEIGHVHQVLYFKRKILEALRESGDAGGLSPKEANKIASRFIYQARKTDEVYDFLTNHGKWQGVKRPE